MAAMPTLCDKWRKECGLSTTPAAELSPNDFIAWVQEHHSLYLDFQSTMGAARDVEDWFAKTFGQSWRY